MDGEQSSSSNRDLETGKSPKEKKVGGIEGGGKGRGEKNRHSTLVMTIHLNRTNNRKFKIWYVVH